MCVGCEIDKRIILAVLSIIKVNETTDEIVKLSIQQFDRSRNEYTNKLISFRTVYYRDYFNNIFYELTNLLILVSKFKKRCVNTNVDFHKVLSIFYQNIIINGELYLKGSFDHLIKITDIVKHITKNKKIKFKSVNLKDIRKTYEFPCRYEFSDEYNNRKKQLLL